MGNCLKYKKNNSYKPFTNTNYNDETYTVYTVTSELLHECEYCKIKKPIEAILFSTKNKKTFKFYGEKNKVFENILEPTHSVLNSYVYVCSTCLNSMDIAITI